jgi:hypothetical protein
MINNYSKLSKPFQKVSNHSQLHSLSLREAQAEMDVERNAVKMSDRLAPSETIVLLYFLYVRPLISRSIKQIIRLQNAASC